MRERVRCKWLAHRRTVWSQLCQHWFSRKIWLVELKYICDAHVMLGWCMLGWWISRDFTFSGALNHCSLNFPGHASINFLDRVWPTNLANQTITGIQICLNFLVHVWPANLHNWLDFSEPWRMCNKFILQHKGLDLDLCLDLCLDLLVQYLFWSCGILGSKLAPRAVSIQL